MRKGICIFFILLIVFSAGNIAFAREEPFTLASDRTLNPNLRLIDLGWSIEPYLSDRVLGVVYTNTWNSIDLYTSDMSMIYNPSDPKVVSKEIGFESTSMITADEARKYGLVVTEKGELTATDGCAQLNVSAWMKACVRPYIYYYLDTYMAVRTYALINTKTLAIVDLVEVTHTAVNTQAIEAGARVWSVVNEAKDRSAASPEPPLQWEW